MVRTLMGVLVLLGAPVGCSSSGSPEETEATGGPEKTACQGLFGTPSEFTGVSSEQCQPRCRCGDEEWQAPAYSEEDIAALEGLRLIDPPTELEVDPYASDEPPPETSEASVCAVIVGAEGPGSYRLESFESDDAAQAAGAQVTHRGECGLCSGLSDLAVYMRNPDLTQPVRACGVIGLQEGNDANLECLLDLGFTRPCAQIWLYNTVHTRENCLQVCLEAFDEPYLEPDGTLNPCLKCDEEVSGPVFKAIAGRTRRNTGLPSALCRPCAEVSRIVHVYE